MYWWNVRKLAEDLSEGRVDEKERFKYFLANFVAWSLAVLLLFYSPGPFNSEPSVSLAIYPIMAIVGIVFCYKANKSGDNVDFIPRMICLGLPVGIQLAAFFASLLLTIAVIQSLPAAALGLRSFVSRMPGSAWKTWTDTFAPSMGIFLFAVFYFQTIYAYIAFAAKVKDAENSPRLKEKLWLFEQPILGLLSGLGFLVMMAFTGVWVPISDDRLPAWQFLILMGAVILWAGLFSFVLSRLRQRLKKHA